MPRLNDTQTILLSTASRREDFAIYPLEGTASGSAVTKTITGLIKAGFVEDRGEGALFATPAGLQAIDIEAGQGATLAEPVPVSNTAPATKTATVIDLLKRENGATLPDLIAATSWLPHTTRAALTGLRKKGHAIKRFKRDEVTCYRIAG